MNHARSCYELLNVAQTATAEEIKTSYRKLALKHHPDKNGGSLESHIVFQIISNAYEMVSSPEKRSAYDTYLRTSTVNARFVRTDKSALHNFQSFDRGWSREYLAEQFNFLFWEIEDILKALNVPVSPEQRADRSADAWLMVILRFIDQWVLEPGGQGDYFFAARKIHTLNSSDSYGSLRTKNGHQPYVDIDDYFYTVRKRMNRFIVRIQSAELLAEHPALKVTLLECIIESQRMAYYYLGALKRLARGEIKTIEPFIHSRRCFDNHAPDRIGYG